MNNFSKVLWGIVLITIGIVIGLNALEITNINLFFKGWWTLIIIIPSLIGLFNSKEGDIAGNLVRISNRNSTTTWNKGNSRLCINMEIINSNNSSINRIINDI